jgi:regulator of extracellular matrix RemA (YlzA/DUF370 family)
MTLACGYGDVIISGRRCRLTNPVSAPIIVTAPADNTAIRAKGKRMIISCGYGDVIISVRRCRLTIPIVAPADNTAIGAKGKRMIPSCGYGDKIIFDKIAAIYPLPSPADDGAIGKGSLGAKGGYQKKEKNCDARYSTLDARYSWCVGRIAYFIVLSSEILNLKARCLVPIHRDSA